jgi:hypothetical protein
MAMDGPARPCAFSAHEVTVALERGANLSSMSRDSSFEVPVVLYRDPGEGRPLDVGATGHLRLGPDGLAWTPSKTSKRWFPAFVLEWRDVPEGDLRPIMGRGQNGTLVGLKGPGVSWLVYVDYGNQQRVIDELKKHFEIRDEWNLPGPAV